MRKLNQKLRAAIAARYPNPRSKHGSVRAASKDLGLDPNTLQQIVDSEIREPELKTLEAMARLFGWDFMDVIYWTMDREPPAGNQAPPEAVSAILAAANYREGDRAFIVECVRRFAPSVPNADPANRNPVSQS